MSAIAGILADRGYAVSGSDPRDNAVLQDLRSRGVRVFREQSATTIAAIAAIAAATSVGRCLDSDTSFNGYRIASGVYCAVSKCVNSGLNTHCTGDSYR